MSTTNFFGTYFKREFISVPNNSAQSGARSLLVPDKALFITILNNRTGTLNSLVFGQLYVTYTYPTKTQAQAYSFQWNFDPLTEFPKTRVVASSIYVPKGCTQVDVEWNTVDTNDGGFDIDVLVYGIDE